jgi:hypothetical protein
MAAAASDRPLGVSYPFRLVLEHGPLSLTDMFAVTEAFDHYEVKGVAGENAGKARKELYVDVVEVESKRTTLVITPTRPMTYAEIGREVEALVKGVGKKVYEGKVTPAKLVWTIDKTGIASDLKGRIHVVA